MTDSPQLPGLHTQPLDPRNGRFSTQWAGFFRDLAAAIRETTGNTLELAEIEARLAALEAEDEIPFLSPFSVQVLGDGPYTVQLVGDTDAPGASYFYGTDAIGANGWYQRLLATLADVDLTGLADGNALVWNATAERFVPGELSGGGVLPVVTGEISGGQPVFVYGPDGSLVYGPI